MLRNNRCGSNVINETFWEVNESRLTVEGKGGNESAESADDKNGVKLSTALCETVLITNAFWSNCCPDPSDLNISHAAPIFLLMINESPSIHRVRELILYRGFKRR